MSSVEPATAPVPANASDIGLVATATLQRLSDEEYNALRSRLEVIVKQMTNGLNAVTITSTVLLLMKTVGQVKALSGMDKRRIVIDVLQTIIDKSVPEKVEGLKPLMQELVPDLIDSFIDIEKGKIVIDADLKESVKETASFFKGLCACGSKMPQN